MASVWSNTYHSKRDLYLPTPFLDQYTVKLLSHHWLPWQPAQQNVAEKKWNRNLLDFYHEDKACWEKKKIPYISTKSCNFVLSFGKRLLTGLSLSCTILTIAYLNLTTPIYRYCIRHSGSEPFALCLALDRHWLCYSANEQWKNQNNCRHWKFWLQGFFSLFSQWIHF